MPNRQKSPKLTLSAALDDRSIVLVGLMGAGKTCIGKGLASKTGLSFVDADAEIEAAANCTVEEIFARYGEQAFRDGERRVIARLLEGPRQVLATGGGAFVNPETRKNVHRDGVSVWLKADLDILVQRVSRRNDRPLLKNDNPRATLERLIEQRYPCYAEADITVDTGNEPPDSTVGKVVDALNAHAAALTAAALTKDNAAQ
ncbi:MAG: shikimate kinase [Rhodospirillaceae bacterium]|nr:shikimate kinase [Rhodospirillaceae bacterium]